MKVNDGNVFCNASNDIYKIEKNKAFKIASFLVAMDAMMARCHKSYEKTTTVASWYASWK